MQKKDRHLMLFFVVLLFGAIAVGSLSSVFAANTESLNIPPSSEKLLTVNLNQGDNFKGTVSVSGGCSNAVNVWVTNPEGDTVLNVGRVKQGATFEFTAQDTGEYTMHFDNTFSLLSTKVATLSYDVSQAIFDIGMISFVALTATVVIAVLVVVLIYRQKNKLKNTRR